VKLFVTNNTPNMLFIAALVVVAADPNEHATGLPGNFSCASKLLAYEFAAKLQPERDASGMAVIALGLGEIVALLLNQHMECVRVR
jgi:hypothetical protein